MNSKPWIALAVCACLLLGAAILAVQATTKAARMGREAAAAQTESAALRRQLQEATAKPPASSAGMDPEVWRERVNRLQEQLAEKDRLIASLQKPNEAVPAPAGAVATNPPPSEERRPWRDRGAWLEEIKQTDPQRYEEIQARRQEAKQRTQRSIAEQAAYYLNRDTSAMDETEAAEYKKLMGLLDETWRLAEQMQSELPSEERHALMETMRANVDELMPLMESERDRTFYEIGLDSGYTESEAQDFTDYLNKVIEATSVRTLFGGMHGGLGGGGPWGDGERGGGPSDGAGRRGGSPP